MGGLGLVLGALGGVLGLLGALLGASWGLLGRSWGDLGTSWGGLGAFWSPLGAILGPLGVILARLEATLGCEHVSIDVDIDVYSIFGALTHTHAGVLGGDLGRPRGQTKVFQRGLIIGELEPRAISAGPVGNLGEFCCTSYNRKR